MRNADKTKKQLIEELKEKGGLLPYTPLESTEIRDILKGEDGDYCAARLFNMIVTYNTNKRKGKIRNDKVLTKVICGIMLN